MTSTDQKRGLENSEPTAALPEAEIGRLLFVDDDPLTRKLFRAQIEPKGYQVDLAKHSKEALEKLEKKAYDVVVTDLRMPGTDGLGLIRQIRESDFTAAAILVSGDQDMEVPEDRLLDRTLVSVIPKPWDITELLAALSRAEQISGDLRRAHREGASSHSMRILLVEDSDSDAEIFRIYAEEAGLQAEVCVEERLSGALERLEKEHWDLLVTDLALPDARGIDAVRRIRRAAPDVPIIVSSGQDSDELALEALEIGAQDFLSKTDLDGAGLGRTIRAAMVRKRSELRMFDEASSDPLTGLANRAQFRSRLTHALSRSLRGGSPVAVLFVDLDRFKEINDGWGHHAGDAVLCEAASRLRTAVREPDTLARLGGDEFAVLLEDTDSEGALVVGSRICDAVSEPYRVAAEWVETAASVGIAVSPEHAESTDSLLRCADKAMYQAKRGGGSSCRIFGEEGHSRPARFLVARELKNALAKKQFLLQFQPQLSMASGRFQTVEALLRWQRRGKLVPPLEFIPDLEQTGLIEEVGQWVIDESCRAMNQWQLAGLGDLRVAVNVSPLQFESGNLVDSVAKSCEDHGVDPSALEFEITETVVIKDYEKSNLQLQQLRQLGAAIAMDDFGSGFSSLAALHRVEIDVLKMDRSFVGELESCKDSRTLVELIISLGHKLNLQVVAEGVETVEQMKFLQDLRCDRAQGFFHSRPLNAEAVAPFLLAS